MIGLFRISISDLLFAMLGTFRTLAQYRIAEARTMKLSIPTLISALLLVVLM